MSSGNYRVYILKNFYRDEINSALTITSQRLNDISEIVGFKPFGWEILTSRTYGEEILDDLFTYNRRDAFDLHQISLDQQIFDASVSSTYIFKRQMKFDDGSSIWCNHIPTCEHTMENKLSLLNVI